jgi:hypothetical protein
MCVFYGYEEEGDEGESRPELERSDCPKLIPLFNYDSDNGFEHLSSPARHINDIR